MRKNMFGLLTNYFHISVCVLIVSIDVCSSSFNYMNREIRDCTPSFLSRCNQSLTGHWPKEGATKLEVKPHTDMSKMPVLGLEWWFSCVKNLRCFQILLKSDGFKDECKILDYSNQSDNDATYKIYFKKTIPLNTSNRNYTIELYTLPQPDSNPLMIKRNLSIYLCTKWQARFQYVYDGEQIVVTFDKGPQRCNFRNYSVTLFDAGPKHKQIFNITVNEKDGSSKLTATFSEPLCKGMYYIVVVNYKRNECLDFDGVQKGQCTGSSSNYETFIPRIPCERDQNRMMVIHNTNGRPTIIVVIICVLTVILTILLAIYSLKCLHLKPKNRGILLFIDDHPAHSEAVKRLVDYLKECHLEVHLASHLLRHPEDNHQLTILSEVLKSDFVLLVVSSALQKRLEAWGKQQDYIEFFKEKNSNILTKHFLEEIISLNRLHICKFDHVTESDHVIKDGSCFSLPGQLNEMVGALETAGYNLSSFKYLKKRKLLYWLKVSIEKAADYENSNSEWFHKKYFCPRVIVTDERSYAELT